MELGSLRVVPFSLLMRVWSEVGSAIAEGWREERIPGANPAQRYSE